MFVDMEFVVLIVDGERVGMYVLLMEFGDVSVLWFNCVVGLFDLFEWWFIEIFVVDYWYDVLLCCLVLSEIFVGCDVVIMLWFDCDEDVELVCLLWDVYCCFGVLFLFVVNISNFDDFVYYGILCELFVNGGVVLLYMVMYVLNWGGSYE